MTSYLDRALRLREKGLTYAQIRDAIAKSGGPDLSVSHLYKLMRSAGAAPVYQVTDRKATPNPRHLDWLKRRREGQSLQSIATLYSVSKQAVASALKKLVDIPVDAV